MIDPRIRLAATARAAELRQDTPAGAAAARGPGVQVATETAGEVAVWMADAYLIDHCRATGVLAPRLCDAAEELCRARAICLPSPWRRMDGHGDGASDARQADARARYEAMMAAAPAATRPALVTLALGEWPVVAGMPGVLRAGLAAVADHCGMK